MSNFGSININKLTPEQVGLVKKMGSKNKSEALAAQEAFAGFIGDVILAVVEQAPVISNLYTSKSFAEGTAPSLPLDVLFDIKNANYIQVWTQSQAGGVPTNFVHGLDELMVSTYDLLSAISFGKKWAREARLDVVAAIMERMAQEILIKQEYNGASILLNALANARGQVSNLPQIIRSNANRQVTLDDFNRLNTLAARSRPSWVGGTPVGTNFLTDLIGSPEFIEQIRSIAYQPVNTRVPTAGAGAATYLAGAAIAAPDAIRSEVWTNAGIGSFFGTNITNVFEMGINKGTSPNYNDMFATWIGSTTFQGYAQGAAAAFNNATEEIVIGLNLSNPNTLVRLVKDNENGGRVETGVDDSFPIREDKMGFYSKVTEGRVMLDYRSVVGLCF